MASSLVLPSAETLSGQWTVSDKSKSCVVQLNAESVESAGGYSLKFLSDCTPDVLPQEPVAWRPAPDGIALLEGWADRTFLLSGRRSLSQPDLG
ncbi:protease inhibitor Inh/omp19 family protein [Serratia marcescens]|nr:protease inhibitor Inh/omp19 family protein [Serratia marcescens]